MNRLYYNSPAALTLFINNPFPNKPPDYIRIESYLYNFTTIDSHMWNNGDESLFLSKITDSVKTGNPKAWWTRRTWSKNYLGSKPYNSEDLVAYWN